MLTHLLFTVTQEHPDTITYDAWDVECIIQTETYCPCIKSHKPTAIIVMSSGRQYLVHDSGRHVLAEWKEAKIAA